MNQRDNSCESIQRDVVFLVDGELDDERKADVLAHVKNCDECANVLRDLEQLGEQMQLWPAADPSKSWEHRSEQQIRKQAQELLENNRHGSEPEEGVGGKTKPNVIFLRPWFMSAAAACLLFIVLAYSSYSSMSIKKEFTPSSKALVGGKIDSCSQDDFSDGDHYFHHKSLKSFGSADGSHPKHFASDDPNHGLSAGKGPTFGSDAPFDGDAYIKSRGKFQYERTKELVTKRTKTLKIIRLGNNTAGSDYNVEDEDVEDNDVEDTRIQSAPKNGWYQSNYTSGEGGRERVAKLISEAVVVDGSKIKLGSFARSYHQKFSIPASSALALYADVDRGKVMASGGDVFLQVGIQAARRKMRRRPPLNIAIVIDHSGSMNDDGKMDAARQAALKFLNRLRSDDRLVVIAYDEEVTTPCHDDYRECSRDEIRRFIKDLRADGLTNMHGALDRAYRMVAYGARPGMLNSVILLSDGIPTAGNTDEDEIMGLAKVAAENGISSTSVGMGLEYNDHLMMQIASLGQGHYHFVKDASSMESILKEEFDSLNRVVARALRLKIKLADRVVLRRVLGSKALDIDETGKVRDEERRLDDKLYRELGITKDRQEDDEEGVKMLIPYFFSGDSHVVMLHLYLPPGTKPERIAQVTLKYKDLLHGKNGSAEKDVVVGRADNLDGVVKSINRKVKKNLLGFRAGETLMTVARMLDDGEELRGADMLAEQAELFRQAGKRWGDGELVRDSKLLEQYKNNILRLQDPNLTGGDSLRAYLSKTMSHSAHKMFQ